jgi:hypothetical protein
VQEEDDSGHYPTLALNKEAAEASVASIDQRRANDGQ